MKPLIGITVSAGMDECGNNNDNSLFSFANPYIKSIEQLGGTSIVIPIDKNYNMSLDIIDKLDGVVISGKKESTVEEAFKLDGFEEEFCQRIILDSSIPVLGIGRGIKIINCICGGTIEINHISSLAREVIIKEMLRINIQKSTKLLEIINNENLYTYSMHIQKIKKVGRDLRINAISKDNVIEGIEGISDRFILALEWHPELLAPVESINDTNSKNIFKYFIDESLKYRITKC